MIFDMIGGILVCGRQHLKRVEDGTEFVLSCQRKLAHDGRHAAVWFNGYIAWEDVPSKPEGAHA